MGKKFENILLQERNQILNIIRETTFEQFNSDIIHKQIIPYSTYSPWESDIDFKNIYETVKNYTMLDIYRCYELWSLIKELHNIDGNVLEVGVWRGGSGSILCKALEKFNDYKSSGVVFLADTFSGVVKATERDTVYRGGEHADTNISIVSNLLSKLKITNYNLLQGVFPDDFNGLNIGKLRLCHIDVDTYLSAKDIFYNIWDAIEVGGVVVFDDYGFWSCEGVTQFFNALTISNGRKVYNLNGHGLLVKTK